MPGEPSVDTATEGIPEEHVLCCLVDREVRALASARAEVDQEIDVRFPRATSSFRQRLPGIRLAAEQHRLRTAAPRHTLLEVVCKFGASLRDDALVVRRRQRPFRKQDRDTCVTRVVRIRVRRQIDSCLALAVDHREQLPAAFRALAEDHLQMRDVHARVRALRRELVDRAIDRVVILGAHVTHHDAARCTDFPRQRQHLFRLRVDARHILQAGGQSVRARLQIRMQHCSHPRGLRGIQVTHGIRNLRQMPDRPMTRQRRDVDLHA
jgi:hypothetical protein